MKIFFLISIFLKCGFSTRTHHGENCHGVAALYIQYSQQQMKTMITGQRQLTNFKCSGKINNDKLLCH